MVACAAAASCAAHHDATVPISGEIDAAGIALPEHVGPYVASLVQYGGDPRQGAFVRYLPDDSTSDLPRIDVVVYPSSGIELREEVALSHGDLMEADRASAQIDHTTLLTEALVPIDAIHDTAYRATYFATVRDVPQHSIVWLHSSGSSYVKARTSYVIDPGYDPERSVDEVVTTLLASLDEDDSR